MSAEAERAAFVAAAEVEGAVFVTVLEASRFRAHANIPSLMGARFGVHRAMLTGVTDETSRILHAALQLPERERLEIAAILTDSIGDGSSPEEIQASWLAEAKRRLAAYERGETTAVDFDEMMERLRARVRRTRERQASTG